jgi:hypothetical protein
VPINAPAAIRRTISARIVNGRPAVAYEEGEDIFYARATSTSGSAWGAPLLVDGSGENRQAALLVAGGRPAIAYVDERGSNNDHVLFIRASDADGAAWPASSVIVRDADLDNELGPQALTLGGNPALFFGDRPSQSLQLAVATSSAGSAWGEPVTVVNGSTSSVLSTGLVSGNPACVFMGGVGELLYLRADDTGGGSWSGSPVVIADQLRFESRASEQAPSPTLLVSGGLPCVSFVDRTNQMIKLVRASDQNGAAWDDPMIIDFGRIFFGNSAATVLDGKPLVFYVDEFVRESDRFFVTEMIALREQ